MNCAFAVLCNAQSSPAQWLYPDGSPQATRNLPARSAAQNLKHFGIKWSTQLIHGDVKPIVGNLLNRAKLDSTFPYQPNQISGLCGDYLYVIDDKGASLTLGFSTDYAPRTITAGLDTTCTRFFNDNFNPVVLSLELVESKDTVNPTAFSLIIGYDSIAGKLKILRRLAVDLRPFTSSGNYSATIQPYWARSVVNGDVANTVYYATVNMAKPKYGPDENVHYYFRGTTLFSTENEMASLPIPDVGDIENSRYFFAGQLGFEQPSIYFDTVNNNGSALLPLFPENKSNTSKVMNNKILTNLATMEARKPYIAPLRFDEYSIDLCAQDLFEEIPVDTLNNRPMIRSYYFDLNQQNIYNNIFILMTQEFSGFDSSTGTPRVDLVNTDLVKMTGKAANLSPPLISKYKNHKWTIACGNVDGNISNQNNPYYPNNPGHEILITETTRDIAVPFNKLYVYRYRDDVVVPKPSPPGMDLYAFDTICTHSIKGWIGAVNDLDGDPIGKDEVVIADGSTLYVLRMKNYQDEDFLNGTRFDTLLTQKFSQTISNVAVADIEGDGLNDIIVTTYDGTYILGTVKLGTLTVTNPAKYSPVKDLCYCDSIKVEWTNSQKDIGNVRITYTRFEAGLPKDTITLADNYPNPGLKGSFTFFPDTSIVGKDGLTIVSSIANPEDIADYSGMIHIWKPAINSFSYTSSKKKAGDNSVFNISKRCIDSIYFEYSLDTLSWIPTNYAGAIADQNSTDNLTVTMPCIYFGNCGKPQSDTLIYYRVKAAYAKKDTIIEKPVIDTLTQNSLTVTEVVNPGIFPAKTFAWDLKTIAYPAELMNILVSYNSGIDFEKLATLPANEQSFTWNVPLKAPNAFLMSFCMEAGCTRQDIVVTHAQPTMINKIAPNPFRPPYETMEFVYKVPFETNVTIKIIDEYNRIVAEPVKDAIRLPDLLYNDKWDGSIWDASYAANGMYYLIFEMSNGVKEVYSIFVKK